MKHMTIIMPLIKNCSVSECGFNLHDSCHAKAITIGNNNIPSCNTYFQVSDIAEHTKAEGHHAGVGACKLTSCKFNTNYACVADEVLVSKPFEKANCMTYLPKQI